MMRRSLAGEARIPRNVPVSAAIVAERLVAQTVAERLELTRGLAGGVQSAGPAGRLGGVGPGPVGRTGGGASDASGIGSNGGRNTPLQDGHRRSGLLGGAPRWLVGCSELGIEVVCGRTSRTLRGVCSPPTTTAIDE
jgi:hypothetical protein